VVTCLLAFGLYNPRQRTQLSGVLVRLVLALLVSACVFAALFYAFPGRSRAYKVIPRPRIDARKGEAACAAPATSSGVANTISTGGKQSEASCRARRMR